MIGRCGSTSEAMESFISDKSIVGERRPSANAPSGLSRKLFVSLGFAVD